MCLPHNPPLPISNLLQQYSNSPWPLNPFPPVRPVFLPCLPAGDFPSKCSCGHCGYTIPYPFKEDSNPPWYSPSMRSSWEFLTRILTPRVTILWFQNSNPYMWTFIEVSMINVLTPLGSSLATSENPIPLNFWVYKLNLTKSYASYDCPDIPPTRNYEPISQVAAIVSSEA